MTTRREIARIPIPKDAEDAKRLRAVFLLGLCVEQRCMHATDEADEVAHAESVFPSPEEGPVEKFLIPSVVWTEVGAGDQFEITAEDGWRVIRVVEP